MKVPGKTFFRIKPKRSLGVKALLALAACASFSGAWAQDAPPALSTPSDSDQLPEIEARTFDIRAVRKSRNDRIVVFETTKEAIPPVGRLLLLKKDGQPYVAVRVLKSYPEEDHFAAKSVRSYDPNANIAPTDSFLAIEKISDIVPPPPSAQDKADLKELETAPPPPAPSPAPETAPSAPSGNAPLEELAPAPIAPAPETAPPKTPSATAPTAPTPEPATEEEEEGPAAQEEENLGAAVEETTVLDPFRNWLSAGFGLLQNGGSYFAGGGARYGWTISKMPYLRKANMQDSIAIEGAIYFYKILNFSVQNDSYSVLPLTGTVRYNVMFGPNLGAFVYAGISRSFASATSAASSAVMANRLSGLADDGSGLGILPAVGAGLTFRVGPQWDLRFDAGSDIVGMSLMLRF